MIAQLYSGGLDSYLLARKYPSALYIFFDYGQKNGEIDCARDTCPGRLEIITLPTLWQTFSQEMPYRNLLFISAALAAFPAIRELRLAIHANYHGEHYTDCTSEFIDAVSALCLKMHGARVTAPFYSQYLHEMLTGVEDLPRLQICNYISAHNCWQCRKCQEVWKAFTIIGREDFRAKVDGDDGRISHIHHQDVQ